MTPRPGVPAGRQITLKDVAAAAGVHVATASRALAPTGTRHLVRPETARRVADAAARLRYQPNDVAKSLRTRRTRTVGVVVQDLAQPHTAAVVRGICDELAGAGYLAVVASCGDDTRRAITLIRKVAARQVDGLILSAHPALLQTLAAAAGPERPIAAAAAAGGESCPSVSVDLAAGMRAVVMHLALLGHRAIVLLASAGDGARHREYRAAMSGAGLRPLPPLTAAQSHSLAEGERCGRKLARGPLRCTAVIATSDILAAGCCQALAASGLMCPGAVSVAGMGDLPLGSSLAPGLTTLRLPHQRVGELAASLALTMIGGQEPDCASQLVAPQLIVRGSTAPVSLRGGDAGRAEPGGLADQPLVT
jgi:LacI family transcriptional regulator